MTEMGCVDVINAPSKSLPSCVRKAYVSPALSENVCVKPAMPSFQNGAICPGGAVTVTLVAEGA